MKNEAERKRLKRRLSEAEYTRDFCINQLIIAVEEVNQYKEALKILECEEEWEYE